jgi:hypothetical protein
MSNDWQSALVKGPQTRPPRIVIYGGHGIGKSTLGANFPNPIFISTEDGLTSINTTSFPKADSLADVENSIKTLIKEDHDFKTVVLDSVDWLVEPLINDFIESSYEAKDLAYGKGNMLTAEKFRTILQGFDILSKKKNMNVLLIAHAAVVRYENPMTEPYDQFRPKLPNRCNALLQEWADVMAYAAFKEIVKKSDAGFNNTVNRGITTGDRLLHMIEAPAYIAKNRYNAPEAIPMTFADLAKTIPVAV